MSRPLDRHPSIHAAATSVALGADESRAEDAIAPATKSANKEYTVGQYLVDRLCQLGVKHLFSIPGDYTLEWVNGYARHQIDVISDSNELNMGYAADGYARQKGQCGIGALCVTYAAGALSAANAITGAYDERQPVVVISGAPSTGQTLKAEQTGLRPHHFVNDRRTVLKVFEPITAAAVRIEKASLAPLLIDLALTQCITERQPVYIELPEDMVEEECELWKESLKPAKAPRDVQILKESVDQIRGKLESAKSPLIWLGVEVDRFGLEQQAERLIKELNIPYVTQLMGKAVLSENDTHFAGVFDGQASSDAVQALVRNSDFILALGVWLTDINTLGWPPDRVKTAFVSLDSVKSETYFGAPASLEDVIESLLSAGIPSRGQVLPQMPVSEVCKVDIDSEITYQGFYDFIPKYINDKTLIGSDASLNYFGTLLLKVGAERGFFAQPSYSSIGYIVPAATGVCLAKADDERVMVFTGDGGFQETGISAIATQASLGLDPIIFIMDNGVFGVEQWLKNAAVFITDAKFEEGLEVSRWPYSKMAVDVGCQGWKVTTYRELEDALLHARDDMRHKPSIIQVVVDPKSFPKNAEWKAKIDLIKSKR